MDDYVIFTDSSSNLTPDLVKEAELQVISFHCLTHDGEIVCYNDQVPFDGHAFYQSLRQHGPAKTSAINSNQFLQAFEPLVQKGKDILYIAMSGGISSTCANGLQVAKDGRLSSCQA